MAFRVEWAKLKKEFSSEIDIGKISKHAKNFYNLLSNIDDKISTEKIKKLFKAETEVNNARRLVKNLCSPQENEHILEEGDNYAEMNSNLGRVDKQIKETKNKAMASLEMNSDYNMKISSTQVKIEDYKKLLEEALVNLAFYPLNNAVIKYKDENYKFYVQNEGKPTSEIEKDKKLLTYLIYVELLHASESFGAETGEERKSSNKSMILGKANS